jgi:hypothetical protein
MAAICALAAPIPAALEGKHGGRRRDSLGGIKEQRPRWPGRVTCCWEDGGRKRPFGFLLLIGFEFGPVNMCMHFALGACDMFHFWLGSRFGHAWLGRMVSYPVFMLKLSTHRMYNPGSIVTHIRIKVFKDIQISRIKYNYYINNVSKNYDHS